MEPTQYGYLQQLAQRLSIINVLLCFSGYLVFTFDLGSGPAVLKSASSLRNGSIYTVEFGHSGREGYLDVSGQVSMVGISPGSLTKMNGISSLYLGGINADEITLPGEVAARSQFVGE